MPVSVEIAYRRSGHVGPEPFYGPRVLRSFAIDYPIAKLSRSKGRVVILFKSGIELRVGAMKE